MLEKLPRPMIIAHRGASAHAPENTLAAFEQAVQQKADAIELDAMLCADNHVVIIHDNTVDRTTDGNGSVTQLPLAALKELDAGCTFDAAYCGEKIPTLDEVFATYGNKIFINIELKNYTSPTDSLPEKVASVVNHYNLSEHVLFSSFNPMALRRIKKILPQSPIGLLTIPGIAGAWTRSLLRPWIIYNALHPHFQDASQKLINQEHRRGKRLHVYTVNQPKEMVKMYQLGVDGIFTDDPLLARRILEMEPSPEMELS